MLRQVGIALKMCLVTLVLTGVVYPLVVTGVAQVAFRGGANGSLVERDGQVVGSRLIGQAFEGAEWFHPRPSAAGDGYDATASGPSNLGPTSKGLIASVQERAEAVRGENGLAPNAPVPSDLVTASASGLDPDISPEAAYLQAPRVAAARGIPVDQVRELIARETQAPALGIIGRPRVNVLALNLGLTEMR